MKILNFLVLSLILFAFESFSKNESYQNQERIFNNDSLIKEFKEFFSFYDDEINCIDIKEFKNKQLVRVMGIFNKKLSFTGSYRNGWEMPGKTRVNFTFIKPFDYSDSIFLFNQSSKVKSILYKLLQKIYPKEWSLSNIPNKKEFKKSVKFRSKGASKYYFITSDNHGNSNIIEGNVTKISNGTKFVIQIY